MRPSHAEQRIRRLQIASVAVGVSGFLVSLAGGAVRSQALVWIGLSVFAACLAGLPILGLLAHWSRKHS